MKMFKEVAFLFFKLGLVSLGGPSLQLALMEKELVNKNNWFSSERFKDMVALSSFIPGAQGLQLALMCGKIRDNKRGFFVAGIAYLLPSLIIATLVAVLYYFTYRYGFVRGFFSGLRAAVVPILMSVTFILVPRHVKNWKLGSLCAMVAFAAGIGVNSVFVLVVAIMVGILWFSFWDRFSISLNSFSFPLLLPTIGRTICALKSISLAGLILHFLVNLFLYSKSLLKCKALHRS